jgi:hypothetical protein
MDLGIKVACGFQILYSRLLLLSKSHNGEDGGHENNIDADTYLF